jgi:anti-sigma factor (TIGR02949 family)
MTTTFRPMADCARFVPSIDPYLDGELDPGHAVDMEAHVLGCPACAERVATHCAVRLSLRRGADHDRAPDALRAKLCAVMLAEKRRAADAAERGSVPAEPALEPVAQPMAEDGTPPKLVALKYAVAFAAAAGIAFAAGMSRWHRPVEARAGSGAFSYADVGAAPVEFDSMIEDLVALHAHPLPPETTNPEELQRFDPLVGVPVRRPAFQPFGASFDGARVHALRDRRTAALQYSAPGGHRITVYVFDPQVVPVVRATLLRERVVREKPVFVGNLRGYSVAAAQSQPKGVGYALASDLGDDEATKLVLAAVQ